MVSKTKQLASQQHGTVNGFQINYDSPFVENYSLNTSCSCLNHQMEMERYLVECIEYHQRLIGFSEKLNLLWQTAYFVQFLTASLLICFIGLTAISMPVNGDFAKLMGYLISVVFQLGLYCTLGSNLMMQSEAVFKAVYESDWYNQSQRYKYCTRMMIMRGQRPVKITAGRFGTLSLPLFASMLRSSYSYLALLRQMHEK
uniref:Putative odorant receptor n=1 Tax=Reticulitermes speratus TaxID=60591 RepID=A0A0U4VTA3_9NEOP